MHVLNEFRRNALTENQQMMSVSDQKGVEAKPSIAFEEPPKTDSVESEAVDSESKQDEEANDSANDGANNGPDSEQDIQSGAEHSHDEQKGSVSKRIRRPSNRYDEYEISKEMDKTRGSMDANVDDTEPAIAGDLPKIFAVIIESVRSHRDSWPFMESVDPVKLNIPDYFDIIKNPMDFGLIEQRLKDNHFDSLDIFLRDCRQVFQNCYIYNPPGSDIVKMCKKVEKAFEDKVAKVLRGNKPEVRSPADPSTAAHVTPSKKRKSVDVTTPRQRRSSGKKQKMGTPARLESPSTGKKASALAGEHLRFCKSLLKELTSKKHLADAWPFMEPVDPVKLNIPDYFDVIKHPMDLSLVKRKLEGGSYRDAAEFASDIRLMFSNCYRYNPPESDVVQMAKRLHQVFETKFALLPDEVAFPNLATEKSFAPDSRDARIKELEKHLVSVQHELETIRTKEDKARPISRGSGQRKSISKGSDSDDDLSPLSFDEKRQLSLNINKLPGEKLGKILDIIHAHMPHLKDVSSFAVELLCL